MRLRYGFRPHNVSAFANYDTADELLQAIRLWLARIEAGEIATCAGYLITYNVFNGDEPYIPSADKGATPCS